VPFCNKNTRKLHDIKLEIWKQSKTSLHLVVVFAVVIVRSRSLHKTGDLQVGNWHANCQHSSSFLYCVWHFVTRCTWCFYNCRPKRWTVWTYELIMLNSNIVSWVRPPSSHSPCHLVCVPVPYLSCRNTRCTCVPLAYLACQKWGNHSSWKFKYLRENAQKILQFHCRLNVNF